MSSPSLIVITGLPGTGKTTFGKKLAEEYSLLFVSKDHVKEILFESLGYSDREWSKKIGSSSYDILYYITELLLRAGQSCIIETNFNPKFANDVIKELQDMYNAKLLQIRCYADGEVLFHRFKIRAASKDRHAGHADGASLEEWKPALLQGKIEALTVDGLLVDIDTTDFETTDYATVMHAVKTIVNRP